MRFHTFVEFESYLESLGLFSMRLGLERMHAALERMGLARPESVMVHVVGTNGKGSTSGFLDALARAHGLKTGLYLSPHLVNVRERIRIGGRILSENSWLHAANEVLDACADIGLTYFELLTVMALHLFRAAGLDLVILEAGLGGTHDATSAMPADLVVMTPVGLDHEAVLGPTLDDIARDKSGALGRCPAVSGPQEDEVAAIFQHASGSQPLAWLENHRREDGFAIPGQSAPLLLTRALLPEHPSYQLGNAGLALLAWSKLAQTRFWPFEPRLCTEALAQTRFAGRFCRHGRVLVDGAHNPMGLAALCAALEDQDARFDLLVFQAMRDKTLDHALLARLRTMARQVIVPALPGNERACDPSALAARFGADALTAPDLGAALALTTGPVLLCGSLYLVGAYYALHPEHFVL